MYGNLILEMKKRKVTQTAIARSIGRTARGTNKKILGETEFTTGEAMTIKQTFFPDLTLEYLFEKR